MNEWNWEQIRNTKSPPGLLAHHDFPLAKWLIIHGCVCLFEHTYVSASLLFFFLFVLTRNCSVSFFILCHIWWKDQGQQHECNLFALPSPADSRNPLSLRPPDVKWIPQWSRPGHSEWKGCCIWPYMSSWGGPIAICTQKCRKAWRLRDPERCTVCAL